MQLFYEIIKNDLKLIFRDKSLLIMFILPVAIILLCRIGIPKITLLVPVLPSYYWLLVAALTLVTASTPSYLFGFILIDERDENVHTMLRILPVPANFILKTRTAFTVLLGFIFALFILLFNGLVHFGVLSILFISTLFALVPPILTFSITAFAKNKIEAATLYKGLNIILFIPVIAFFIKSELKYLFGIIPFFWTFNAIQNVGTNLIFIFNVSIGILMQSILVFLLYRVYQKKWFN